MQSFRICEVSLELFAEADRYILEATLALTKTVEIFQAYPKLDATIYYVAVEIVKEVFIDASLG